MKTIQSSLFHRILPPDSTSDTRHPLVLFLHGRGADENDLLGLADSFDPRCMFISVRAPFPFGYGGGYTWYDIGEVGRPDPEKFRASCDALTQCIDDILTGYPVDPARVILYGFSMGSVMANAMALTMPEKIRAVSANSGYVAEGTHLTYRWNDLSHLDVHLAHGLHDPVIPVAFGHRARELYGASNAHWEYKEFPMAHEISMESLNATVTWLDRVLFPGT